ncbi:glycosyltransferase family 2 protein [Enterobacter cloacae]|uniref:glycosyltransferase family 2 protein n=1 Tax=Enterobacter cloacae TaxID=550 RepID=UPI0034DD32A9
MKGYSAVIVLFHPDVIHLKQMIDLLQKQVEHIIIVDNTPLKSSFETSEINVHLISLNDNLGIATAQNEGIRKSIELGCTRCFLFNQDSIIPSNIGQQLAKDMDFLLNKGIPVACIGPRILDVIEGKIEISKNEKKSPQGLTETRQIIASGSLLELNSIGKIGLMEDGLFIDAVDHEWCWRARAKGYAIYISENVIMEHMIGLGRGRVLFWNYILCSPVRHYYQFRNTFALLSRGYVPLKWKIKKVIELIAMPIVYFLRGPQRKLRVHYMFSGIKDGISGVSGKLNNGK